MADVADDVQQVLSAMGEPTRFRIVALLAERPYAVGEVAEALGALQPQTTKHLQALEAAGVVTIHRLGRRRVAQLDRGVLAGVAAHLSALAEPSPDDIALADYGRDVDRDEALVASGAADRTLRFERELPADRRAVWSAWTDPAKTAQWWAPRHFDVTTFELEPKAGAQIRVVLREGDGAEHESRGRVESARSGRLVFTLAPLDPAGRPLFSARHVVTMTGRASTRLSLSIEVTEVQPGAAAAVAGLEPGWNQLLDVLTDFLAE